MANPKIAWQRVLAPHAKGELWLWSDADIVAPPGFLAAARAEFETCGAEMLTFPYVIRRLPHGASLLDALFVNTEFYPGVLLLRRCGGVDFGLGAGMLFSRESFLRHADWETLGAALADDFALGQAMGSVRISATVLETVSDARTWPEAVAHYWRWKKTVYWCRPGGFAAQLIIMPLFGWIAFVAGNPFNPWAWLGLVAMMQADVIFAALIFRRLGCSWTGSFAVTAQAWSLGRIVFWFLCWLPGRVKWRKQSWAKTWETGQARG